MTSYVLGLSAVEVLLAPELNFPGAGPTRTATISRWLQLQIRAVRERRAQHRLTQTPPGRSGAVANRRSDRTTDRYAPRRGTKFLRVAVWGGLGADNIP